MPGMPDVAANSAPLMFGDFKRGYQIVDRVGVRVLRDPFSNKPYINFYTTKRVGGGLLNPDVLKALKISL
ncbi:phage major capsid protein [Cupriavidus basilensis]